MVAAAEEKERAKLEGEIARLTEKHDAGMATLREEAGVKPRFERLNGAEPTAYIISTNIRRRHLNAGQTAILLARAYPAPKRGVHSELKFSTEVDKADLSRARMIEQYAPELGDHH